MRYTPEQRLRWHMVMMSYKSSVRKAARFHDVSVSLVYKFRRRYKQEGMEGVKSRSRAPKNPFRKVTPRVEAWIVYLKKKLSGWGATRMKYLLEHVNINLSEPKIRKTWKKRDLTPKKRFKPRGSSENIKGGRKNASRSSALQ
ncbi:MAG: helix-turn-helix domain-containing protein [Candidatus Odinarchaeota archaeon]